MVSTVGIAGKRGNAALWRASGGVGRGGKGKRAGGDEGFVHGVFLMAGGQLIDRATGGWCPVGARRMLALLRAGRANAWGYAFFI